MQQEIILSLKNVSKVYGSDKYSFTVLDDINLDIHTGEFIVIFGPSGSGKSTLLNIIGGMDKITRGSILYQGDDLSQASDHRLTLYRRYDIGFVFQFYNLVPTLTALENVQVSVELAKDPLDSLEALDLVGIKQFASHFPAQLSGGQQQRVSIARALACNPTMLMCDEPTGALDSQSSQQVINIIKDIHQRLGKTIIMVTHDRVLADYGDRVIEINDGKIANIIEHAQTTL